MTYRVYFGRPLFVEAEPFRIELNKNVSMGGRGPNSCAFPLRFNHKIYVDLNHHRTTGITIDSVTLDQLAGLRKEIMWRYELYTVTIDDTRAQSDMVEMFVELSFERMTKQIF